MEVLDPLGWAVVLLIIALGLVVMEVFIPSGGVLGFLALATVIGAIVLAFRRGATAGLGFTAAALLLAPLVIGLAFKLWPKTPMGRAFLGELATEDQVRHADPRRHLIGRVGVAQSKMLPSGAVLVDGQYIDAVARGVAIEQGEPVTIVEVAANRVVVRVAKPEEVASANLQPADPLSRPLEDFGLESIDSTDGPTA